MCKPSLVSVWDSSMIETPARHQFTEGITSEAALRELVIKKQLPVLDRHCRAFIALSPFLLIGTANASGQCDVSPHGDAPGFVLALDDHTLASYSRPPRQPAD